mgnify:CR=1 FL=1
MDSLKATGGGDEEDTDGVRGVDLVELVDGFELHIPLCDDVDEAEIGGSISISKTACPVGFDAYAADVYDLALNCNDPLANIQFILSDGAKEIAQNSTNATGPTKPVCKDSFVMF